jgi:hypothetical protein
MACRGTAYFYYQIPVSPGSRRVTAFCTPFGLYEFCKRHMGVSVGFQGLSRVVYELFLDLKGKYVFNFMEHLVFYSSSVSEHEIHFVRFFFVFRAQALP